MKNILIIVVVAIFTFLVYWFLLKEENSQNYVDYISIHRHERAEFFRYSPESPFLKQQVNFSYLDYFPANTNYRIEANFIKNKTIDTLWLATSTGTIDKYIVIGKAQFSFNQTNSELLVLGSTNSRDQSVFIPFLDKTSGNTTYGAGRYLDAAYPSGNKILLDFNKSYNPYCAYTDAYTCPFPPKENRLSIAIEAGEKSFPDY